VPVGGGRTSGPAIRDEVVRAILDAGWQLQELRSASLSLEQIFLDATAATQEAARRPPRN